MSYSYANAKKMRKRTKVEQLKTEINIQKQMVNRLASALLLAKNALDRFGDSSRWLEKHNDGEEPPTVDYIWSGEEDPTKRVALVTEKIMERLGPLSGMFGVTKPSETPAPSVESTDSQPPDPAQC